MTSAQPIQTITVSGRTVQLFDSGIIYPESRQVSGNLTDIVTNLSIPSSRYYYLSNKGNPIPYPALAPPEQVYRDIRAWQNLDEIGAPTIYAFPIVDPVDPGIDFINITEGRLVHISNRSIDERRRRYSGLADLLETLRQAPPNERFVLELNEVLIAQMYTHPFNSLAQFIRASQLAQGKNAENIQQYLNEIGIIHFKAEDIINYHEYFIFFFLTRFYGPPVSMANLIPVSTMTKYLKLARNVIAADIARNIPQFDNFERDRSAFEVYFNAYNENPDANIHESLGAASRDLLIQDLALYIQLSRQPPNLPVLTLNTIRQLQVDDINNLITFLSQYTDMQIFSLVGRFDAISREDLLRTAAEQLWGTQVFLLLPQEAELCRNEETFLTLEEFKDLDRPFLGIGNIVNGLDCYDISELFESFESNRTTDGIYIFRDPLHYEREFQVQDLEDMRDAAASGRMPVEQDIIDQFNQYITQARAQASSEFRQIRPFRQFAQQSDANRQLLRDVFMSYFHMGMYMRQWRGPGNPYPIFASETGRTTEGVAPEQISQNVTQENGRLNQLLDRLPSELRDSFWQLNAMARQYGHIRRTEYTLQVFYRDVVETGEFCIRLASAPWAFTGAYYLKQTLNEDIPGFDLGQGLEYIQ